MRGPCCLTAPPLLKNPLLPVVGTRHFHRLHGSSLCSAYTMFIAAIPGSSLRQDLQQNVTAGVSKVPKVSGESTCH